VYLIEIYKSIQGESSFAGVPCIFVRLAGCNLRCAWCDSEYTFTGGYKLSEDEVVAEVEKLAPVKLVEFTGGEPMLQEKELVPLMERLLGQGYELMIETSGERPLERVPRAVHKIVDVKCPGSGEGGSFRMANLECLTERDEVKFVILSREDYEFARDFIREHGLERRAGQVLDPRELVEWMLADGVPARLSLQIHKYVWEPLKKGV
jgi:7-carboxy-7-deazaguanine synthase